MHGAQRRRNLFVATAALSLTLAGCGALGGADDPAADEPAQEQPGAQEPDTSDGGAGQADQDDSGDSDSGGSDQDGEGGSGDEDSTDEGEDQAGSGGGDLEPLSYDGYGPGTVALVESAPGVGETVTGDQLTELLAAEITDGDINCTDDLEIGSEKTVTCSTSTEETEFSVVAVNVDEASSSLLASTGPLPQTMLQEAHSEQARTFVVPDSGDAEKGARDADMVGRVNQSFPNAGGAPEYEVRECRGGIGPLPAGDEYEYTAASCSGTIQGTNSAVFRVASATDMDETPVLVVTAAFRG